ncbi:MAG: hypothetical protein JKY09_07160 [Crocinitomicaceae bacterium]|nr:hypothetical protein [Crocinitomicaceae bacterium]
MKKLVLSLAMTVIAAVSASAQLTQGHVSYSVEMSTDNPQMEAMISMMQGSTFDIYFKDDFSKTVVKMGAMVTMSTITDGDSEEMLLLLEGMMGKKAIKSTLADMKAEAAEVPEHEITLVDETKEIEGYTCKKAIITDEDGNETVYWYTEEIEIKKGGQSYLSEEIPGFPLEFEVNQGGMILSLTATNFDKKIKDADEVFDMHIPDGFDEMTLEQLQSMGM